MNSRLFDLSGKVAVITGGNGGIGLGMAKGLAGAGAAIVVAGRDAAKNADAVEQLQALGAEAIALPVDVLKEESCRALIADTMKAHGRLDILVNNAGLIGMRRPDGYDIDEFDRMYAVNVRAALVAAEAAQAAMGEGGRIIMIGSIVADRVGVPGGAIYASTKGAIAAMTRGLARDYGPKGITINNVQPGPTETDMNPPDSPHRPWLTAQSPLGRVGQPEEIANLVAFVASPQSSYINGASLTVDGGFTL